MFKNLRLNIIASIKFYFKLDFFLLAAAALLLFVLTARRTAQKVTKKVKKV